MPRNGNGELIEVDFTPEQDVGELMDDVRLRLDELRRDVAEQEAWRRWQDRANRRGLRDLRRQLAAERAANEPTDAEVLAALADLDEPAAAQELAARLYRRRPTHSAAVRVGLALSRLETEGCVARVRVEAHGEERNRWEAVKCLA